MEEKEFTVRGLSLIFFPNGNTSNHEVESGTAKKRDLARKVYISCMEGYEIAAEVLTIPETKKLIKALQALVKRGEEKQ